jgi:methylmalonyl-CoA mutase cobalamin-binding subunit
MSSKSNGSPLYHEQNGKKRRVMVGAIGKCVHNLGVENFADWMHDRGEGSSRSSSGRRTHQEVINKVREARPRSSASPCGWATCTWTS